MAVKIFRVDYRRIYLLTALKFSQNIQETHDRIIFVDKVAGPWLNLIKFEKTNTFPKKKLRKKLIAIIK